MIEPKLEFINAAAQDAVLLSETALASKKFWGYTDDLLDLWREDLEISSDYIAQNKTVKVYADGTFIGFYALKSADESQVELDHLWLKPEKINKGYGRLLFNHLLHQLATEGFDRMTLVAEPHAIGFYQKMGGSVISKFESKIKGRFLDIYEFKLP